MGSQNEMMIQTMDLAEGVTNHSGAAEVEEDIGGREPMASKGTFGRLTLFKKKQFGWTD